jgi:citrate lyase beta subunit
MESSGLKIVSHSESQQVAVRAHWMRVDCADTSVIRTDSRKELLYARSQIVVAAKAFGLDAIDMVL